MASSASLAYDFFRFVSRPRLDSARSLLGSGHSFSLSVYGD